MKTHPVKIMADTKGSRSDLSTLLMADRAVACGRIMPSVAADIRLPNLSQSARDDSPRLLS